LHIISQPGVEKKACIILTAIWNTIVVFPIGVFVPARLDVMALHQPSEETMAIFFAAPFFVTLMTEKDYWLPIISGVTFSMGVIAAIDTMYPQLETVPIVGIQNGLPIGLLPLCISLILFILWRLRVSIPVN
jgi:hypothetical protein